MKITLPIFQSKIVDDKKVTNIIDKEFELDLSLASQIRFETYFPKLAEYEDLLGYMERIMLQDLSVAKILSIEKFLYCWFNTDLTFIEFVSLFDLSNDDYRKKLLNKVYNIVDIITNSSSEKN